MDIVTILKKSISLNLINIISKFIALIIFIYVSSILTVKDFGQVGAINLLAQYLFLFSVIFTSATIREIPILDKTNRSEADKKLSWSIKQDLLFFLVPVIICMLFYLQNRDEEYGYIYLLLGLFIAFQKLFQIWSSITITRKEIDLLFKSRAIQTIGFSLGFVFIASYDILIAFILYPFLGYFAGWAYLNSKKIYRHNLKELNFDKKKIVKAGLSLQLLTICFWGFRLIDRTTVAYFFSTEALGIYTFIATIVFFLRLAVGEFHNLLQPYVWQIIHDDNNKQKKLEKITFVAGLIGLFVVFFSQAGFYFITKHISTAYFDYRNIFYVLSYSLFFIAIQGVTGMILKSKTYSKISISTTFYIIGIIFNLVGVLIILTFDLGLIGVASCMVISIVLTTFPLFTFCKKTLFTNEYELTKLFFIFYIPVILVMLLQNYFNLGIAFICLMIAILLLMTFMNRKKVYKLVK